MDKKRAMMQALWRQAGQQNEPVEIPCESHNEAIKFRFAMYGAVSKIRKGKEPADQALKDAIENCSIGYKKGENNVLQVSQTTATKLMGVIANVLGPEVMANLQDGETQGVNESGKALLERLAQEGLVDRREPVKSSNPYAAAMAHNHEQKK